MIYYDWESLFSIFYFYYTLSYYFLGGFYFIFFYNKKILDYYLHLIDFKITKRLIIIIILKQITSIPKTKKNEERQRKYSKI